MERTDYDNELVDRCAPRWAWQVIDETLVNDMRAGNFDQALRDQIEEAYDAMVEACENPEGEKL